MAKSQKDVVQDAVGNEIDLPAVSGEISNFPVAAPNPTQVAAPAATALATQTSLGGDDDETGFEEFTSADLAVSFLNLLQKGSPQVEEDNKAAYIPGAKPGMAFNSVTRELYDTKERGIVIIPVHRVHHFVEWIPRDQGGGFAGVHAVDSTVVKAATAARDRMPKDKQPGSGKLPGPDGNDLVETFNVFCLIVKEDGEIDRVIVSFASTNIKFYKAWMTRATSLLDLDEQTGRKKTPPMWSRLYLLKSKFNQDDQYTWYTWDVDFVGGDGRKDEAKVPKGSPLWDQAKAFRNLVTSGMAQARYDTANSAGTGVGGGIGSDDSDAF